MMFCAMGSNAILLHFGQWQFLSGLVARFGSSHGKGEMVGVGAGLPFKYSTIKEMNDSARNSS